MRCTLVTPDDDRPRPLDVITCVEYRGGVLTAYTQRSRSFYARHLIATPRTLIGWALRVAWDDLKGIVRGRPRPIQTVADALGPQ